MSRSQPQGLVLKASRVLLKNPLPRTGVEGDIEAQGPASKAQLTLAALTCKTGRTGLHGAGGGGHWGEPAVWSGPGSCDDKKVVMAEGAAVSHRLVEGDGFLSGGWERRARQFSGALTLERGLEK